MGFFIIIILIFLVILLFSSKTFSPIPYFPSQKVDLPLIIKSLKLRNNQVVFDLGAGDGVVIFNAAKLAYKKKLNTKFIAVEINPVLIVILYFKRLFHPNRGNIIIKMTDIFKMNYENYLRDKLMKSYTFYLYISPWFLKKTIMNIKRQLESFEIITYMYPLKFKKSKQVIKGKNSVFVYNL